jgi:cell division protease FtsH
MQLPVDDRHTYSKTYLQNNLAVLFGGRAAEEIVFNSITTGAGNDIERATAMAKRMVCEWGMSEEFGPMALGKKDDEVFLGRDMAHIKDYSEETAKLIDLEVKRILGDSYSRARTILDDNIDVLHSLSQALIERETLTGEEVAMIINGEELAAPVNGVKSAADAPAEPETSPTASGEEGFTLDEEDSGDKAGE